MGMTYRRRMLGGQKTWVELLNVKASGSIAGTANIYIDFPISKLVGSNSEYVIAIIESNELVDMVEHMFYIVPRSSIGSNPYDNCIQFSTDIKGTAVTAFVSYSFDGMNIGWSVSNSSYLASAGGSNQPNNITYSYYYITDANVVPILDAFIFTYIDYDAGGGSSGNCSKGGDHDLVLQYREFVTCPDCGNGYSYQQWKCTKCGDVVDKLCPYC